MDNIIFGLFIAVSVPIFLMTFVVEKRARLPIQFMFAGILVSLVASELNSVLRSALEMETYKITVVVTPTTEEILKALPVLYYAILISDKKEKLFTAAMSVGVGFAVLENAYYFLNFPNIDFFSSVIRAFGSGLMHGMCTLLVGVGISFVKKKQKLFVVGTFGLLSTAIVYHGIYNILIQSKYSIIGALLPIVTYVPFFIWRSRIKKRQAANSVE